jgi:hypothetical protein
MANLFRGDGERARAADLAASLDALQPRQHAVGEQRHVAFSHIVRHAAVAERTCQGSTITIEPSFTLRARPEFSTQAKPGIASLNGLDFTGKVVQVRIPSGKRTANV